jgi:hypothetical protein
VDNIPDKEPTLLMRSLRHLYDDLLEDDRFVNLFSPLEDRPRLDDEIEADDMVLDPDTLELEPGRKYMYKLSKIN